MGVVVHIDKFSGPMALLLHLIRREEMDIFDINIQEITQQYLDSIRAMKKLNLELAGDFIAMAATLIQIKSRMLLPQYNEQGEEIVQDDPRKDLVKRLLEYQMYQEAGVALYGRNLVGRNQWLRGYHEEITVDDGEIVIEEENALYALISAYRSTIKKMKKAVHRVSSSLQSIADRIWQMRELLVVGQNVTLSQLVVCGPQFEEEEKKGRLLITFLSLLELAKIGLVSLFQSDNFAEIHVETKNQIDKDAISNVENYESQIGQEKQASGDIWLNEDDRQGTQMNMAMPDPVNELVAEEALELAQKAATDLDNAASAVEIEAEVPVSNLHILKPENLVFEEEAATDEEIELEEKLYAERDKETEI